MSAPVTIQTPLALRDPERVDAGRTGASHLVTVTGPEITAEVLSAVLHRLVSVSTVVCGMRTMATHPCTALELSVRLSTPLGNAEAALRVGLGRLAGQCEVDISLLRAERRYGLVVFDVDNTLVVGEVVDRLAERAGRAAEVGVLTARTMRGELDFAESLRQRVAMLAGLPVGVLERVTSEIHLMPGALVAVRTLQALGVKVGAISGGFTPVVAALARSLRLDFHAANDLEVAEGHLTGRLTGELIDAPAKVRALRRFATTERIPLPSCVAVGDGANDTDMLKAAGLGIAFNATDQVRAAADVAVSYPRLDLVLPMLGVPVPCALVGG
ncbi:phosphoserine phosphatase SerB [Actinokineospora auranticolor]|uniref:phosphoserine phosphatase n=1 Tax=Actinokineospora auranticolor TaxID=155976 RepID=A0A2S6GDH8_9PSEU|nr:phosphoserine phosphatase SerB [Actinokineospora auranticolor]PPK63171.1 phosphoserine phosphatase [Actinokineospora auranticolor]